MTGRRLLLVLLMLAAASTAALAQGTYAIQNARLVTGHGPVIARGTLIIRDGKIADIGTSVPVPAGATIIDGRGLSVFPGLFEADTILGLTEVGGVTESDDFSDIGEFTPQLLAFNAFHAESEWVAIARVEGITQALSNPSGGTVPGQGAVMSLGGWTPEQMEISRHGAMILDFPKLLNYEPPAYQRRRRPYAENKSYDVKMRELTGFFARARQYADAKRKAGPGGLQGAAFDASLDAFVPVIEGRQVVLIAADSDLDIRKAVDFARQQKLNYVLLGATDAWKMADFLKENEVRVILGSRSRLPVREDDPIDINCRTPAILHEKGVKFAISTGSPSVDIRDLRHDAGHTVACGLPYDEALRSVTLTPAEFLGVADTVGSLEKGKKANLVVADGDLLEYGTHVTHLFINGAPVAVQSRHTQLRDKYKDRR